MRLWSLMILLVLAVSTAAWEKKEPDLISVSGSVLESPYFKFHYSFPPGWLALDDAVRMDENRKMHQKVGPGHWTYNLLLASPRPVSSLEKLSLPYVHILAIENAEGLFGNGNYSKSLAKVKSLAILHPPQQKKIAGQTFTRTDLADRDMHYEAIFDTTVRNYLLVFEFHGRTQEEMDELAKSMESLKFDK